MSILLLLILLNGIVDDISSDAFYCVVLLFLMTLQSILSIVLDTGTTVFMAF